MNTNKLKDLAKLIRYYILASTTAAGSGHPSSSLSATDLMTVLLFGGFFRFDLDNPQNPSNDRFIFSKGHASPLFYSLYLAAGAITPDEIMTLRKFDSVLEGHPTPRFKYTEAATGSLGQGLSVGVGMALGSRLKFSSLSDLSNLNKLPKIFVLLGDGEMAEGSVWEAANLASYYKLGHLCAIVDVNRLGQTQETMFGWDTEKYEDRLKAFGWETVVIDGHDYEEIIQAFKNHESGILSQESRGEGKPFAIIAKTKKGKGISRLENKDNWHGKPLPKDQLEAALKELGEVHLTFRGEFPKPVADLSDLNHISTLRTSEQSKPIYAVGAEVATREAYGDALASFGEIYQDIVALDAEVKNSTYSEKFMAKFPDRFFEMFIAEQNMVGAAAGFSRLGFKPFVSTFAAFFTRAYDQIRMANLGRTDIKFCGSHAGVSIGEDGPSQMGLEDISMMRSIFGSVVLYPADAVSTHRLVEDLYKHCGIGYLRTTRGKTPVIYGPDEEFPIGGSKVHSLSPKSLKSPKLPKKSKVVTIIAAGITLFEALKAQEELAKSGIEIQVIDCYSIKPIDAEAIRKVGVESEAIFTVEDHWIIGGLGDAVLEVLADQKSCPVYKMGIGKMPRSGKPGELMEYEGISANAIIGKVKSITKYGR